MTSERQAEHRRRVWASAAAAAAALACVLLYTRVQGGAARSPTQTAVADSGPSSAPGAAAAAQVHGGMARRADAAATPAVERGAAPSAFGGVQVVALDLQTRRRIEGVTWRVVGEAVGMMPRGHSAHGEARIEVPLRTEAAVALSAPGYRESLPVDVSLRDGHFRRIEVPLAPIGALPCVRFTARTAAGAPVTRLMVRWDPRLAGDAHRGHVRGEEFVVAAEDGRHEVALPSAGWGQLSLVAVDEDGVALPHLPHESAVLVRDAPTELPEVRFAPGVVVVVDVDAASIAELPSSLRLETGSGAILPVRFGLAPPSLGRPDAPWVRCVAATAVAPGRYRLAASSGDRRRNQPVDAMVSGLVRIALH